MSRKFVQTPAVALYTGMSASATTARISPNPVDLDGVKLVIGDFGTIGYITIDPKVSGYEEVVSFTGITDNGDNTATLTGLTRNLSGKSPYSAGTGKAHGASAVVVFSDAAPLLGGIPFKENDETITGQWTFNVFPITPSNSDASTAVKGVTKLSVAPAVASNPTAVGDNDPRMPSAAPTTLFAPLSAAVPTGSVFQFSGRVAPTSYVLADGTAYSRTVQAALFAVVCPSQTFTVVAATDLFTANAHGLVAGDKVHFTSTVTLPAGISTNTDYFVIASGLTTNAFKVSATRGGATIDVTDTGTGVHTVYASNHGKGDGSTTFNVPDYRGFTPYGYKSTDTNFDVLNTPSAYVGEKTHQLTTAELAAHTHGIQGGGGAAAGIITGANSDGSTVSASTRSAGSDTAHNNMPPYLVTHFIIKT